MRKILGARRAYNGALPGFGCFFHPEVWVGIKWDWEEDARWGEMSAKAWRGGWIISNSFMPPVLGSLGTKQRTSQMQAFREITVITK